MYDRNGTRIGVVEHVMAEGNIFEGLIIHTHPLPGRHLYADAAQVAEIREQQGGLEARLRRAFDWLTRRT